MPMQPRHEIPELSNVDEGFAWMESLTNLERGGYRPREYRLERMAELLRDFGSPHLGLPTIHIAGSKGKGSTAALVASGLRALGFRAGMYSSPHVSDYRERIRVNGEFADEEILLVQLQRIYRAIQPLQHHADAGRRLPTTFELLTLLAFLVFRSQQCDWIVLETGLGGRLDATNLCDPDLCIITPIELEHTEYLGHTLPEIAREKAGILKSGVPAVISPQSVEVDRTLSICADERAVPLRRTAELISVEHIRTESTRTTAMLKERSPDPRPLTGPESLTGPEPLTGSNRASSKEHALQLSMAGTAQAENAATAFAALRSLFPEADPAHILAGFSTARIPGRAEHIPGNPPVLLDGAHTAGSMQRLAETIESLTRKPRVLIFGSVEGKPIEPMAEALDGLADYVIVSKPGSFKPSNPDEIARVFSNFQAPVDLLPDPEDALACARRLAGDNGSIIVTGSFYMVCEIRSLIV